VSTALLARLSREGAFDPTPLPADLAALHVPFDELLGQPETEATLAAAAVAKGRIALVGPMGSGKSSVLAHVFQAERGFAPIHVSVAPEQDSTVTDPGAFAQHVVRVVGAWAAEVEMLEPSELEELLHAVSDRRVLPSRRTTHRGRIALQLPWLARAELARELTRELKTSEELSRSAVEYLTALERMFRLIRTVELTPVLVIDDSDRWLRRGEPRPDIVAAFFGRIVRELANFALGFTVAVHERYLELDEYRESTVGILNTRIDVPSLTDGDQLVRILDHRVELHATGHSTLEVFDVAALQRLWVFYLGEADLSLRKTLQIAHTALSDALRVEQEQIGPALVEAAVAAWSPPHQPSPGE
jgi:hypothetical protein